MVQECQNQNGRKAKIVEKFANMCGVNPRETKVICRTISIRNCTVIIEPVL
jgi:hypothetical protein